MTETQFNHVSVEKKANIYFEGRCMSHTVLFADGKKKMLGVILPGDEELKFATHTSEKIEIISGECYVQLPSNNNFQNYRAGQSFFVKGNSHFTLKCSEVVNYVCHLEG